MFDTVQTEEDALSQEPEAYWDFARVRSAQENINLMIYFIISILQCYCTLKPQSNSLLLFNKALKHVFSFRHMLQSC